jgi:hypothetical protein
MSAVRLGQGLSSTGFGKTALLPDYGRVADQHNAFRWYSLIQRGLVGGEHVVAGGWVRVLRGQPVVDQQHRQGGRRRQPTSEDTGRFVVLKPAGCK